MRKTVITVISILVVLAFVPFMGYVLEPKYMKVYTDQVEAFHSFEENSLDLIVYGSSHAWLGIDTRVLSDEYGISSYNYGCSWQSWDTTKLFFYDSLRTQSPKYVVIDIFNIGVFTYDGQLPNPEVNYTKEISMCKAKKEYLANAFKNDWHEYINYYIPFCQYHTNWSELCSSEDNYDYSYKSKYVKDRGFRPGENREKISLKDYRDFPQWELREDSIDVLDSIIEECDDRGIQLILITVPCEGDYWYNDAVRSYISDKNCVYIDCWEELDKIGIDENTDFSDYAHLNTYGAGKIANYIGDYILENYEVTD